MSKMNKTMNFFKYYLPGEIFKTFLTSFLFFAVPASVICIAGVQTILLMVPQLIYVIGVMYVLLLATLFFSTKVLIDTFKNYKDYNEFDYKLVYWLFFIIMAVIITIAGLIVILLFS